MADYNLTSLAVLPVHRCFSLLDSTRDSQTSVQASRVPYSRAVHAALADHVAIETGTRRHADADAACTRMRATYAVKVCINNADCADAIPADWHGVSAWLRCKYASDDSSICATTSAETSPDYEAEVDLDLATSRSVNALSPQGHKEPIRGRSMSCLRFDAADETSSMQPANPGDRLVRIEWIRLSRSGAEERQRKVLSVPSSATVPDLIEMVRLLCSWSAKLRAIFAASAEDPVVC